MAAKLLAVKFEELKKSFPLKFSQEMCKHVWAKFNPHSRFSQNPSQAKNQKKFSNESKAIFQYPCMRKFYTEILRIGFLSYFRDFGPYRSKIDLKD